MQYGENRANDSVGTGSDPLPFPEMLFQFPLIGVMSFSKINSEGFKSPVTGTRVLEILCVKNRPERPLRSLIAKAHSQKPNCSTPIKAKKS